MQSLYAIVLLFSLGYITLPAKGDWWSDCPPPFKWSQCEGQGSLKFTAKTVSLTPDPPVIGEDATFGIVGEYQGEDIDVTKGSTIEITVFYAGDDPIYTETDALCEKASCPITKGAIEFTYVQNLPPIAPPGCYKVEVTAHADGELLMCVDVFFNMTFSEALTATREVANTVRGATERKLQGAGTDIAARAVALSGNNDHQFESQVESESDFYNSVKPYIENAMRQRKEDAMSFSFTVPNVKLPQ